MRNEGESERDLCGWVRVSEVTTNQPRKERKHTHEPTEHTAVVYYTLLHAVRSQPGNTSVVRPFSLDPEDIDSQGKARQASKPGSNNGSYTTTCRISCSVVNVNTAAVGRQEGRQAGRLAGMVV